MAARAFTNAFGKRASFTYSFWEANEKSRRRDLTAVGDWWRKINKATEQTSSAVLVVKGRR